MMHSKTKVIDEAWDQKFDRKPTNYKLKDGDQIELLAQTMARDVSVPAGTTGVVQRARTARTYRSPGVTSCYFTNVDVTINGEVLRVRIPHGAVKIINPKKV